MDEIEIVHRISELVEDGPRCKPQAITPAWCR